MIQVNATELRIGNKIYWLHEEHESVLTVDAEMIKDIDDYNKNPEDDKYSRGMWWSSIPLTPSILEKAGFKEREHLEDWYIHINEYGSILSVGSKRTCVCAQNSQPVYLKTLKTVDQLQNLYFSITGQELTINL